MRRQRLREAQRRLAEVQERLERALASQRRRCTRHERHLHDRGATGRASNPAGVPIRLPEPLLAATSLVAILAIALALSAGSARSMPPTPRRRTRRQSEHRARAQALEPALGAAFANPPSGVRRRRAVSVHQRSDGERRTLPNVGAHFTRHGQHEAIAGKDLPALPSVFAPASRTTGERSLRHRRRDLEAEAVAERPDA